MFRRVSIKGPTLMLRYTLLISLIVSFIFSVSLLLLYGCHKSTTAKSLEHTAALNQLNQAMTAFCDDTFRITLSGVRSVSDLQTSGINDLKIDGTTVSGK